MDSDELKNENTRKAIGVMTAWSTGDGTGMAVEEISALVEEQGVEALAALTAGLVNLSGVLLLLRERELAQSPAATLRDIGEYIASGPLNLPRE
jgi:hypothetical protein